MLKANRLTAAILIAMTVPLAACNNQEPAMEDDASQSQPADNQSNANDATEDNAAGMSSSGQSQEQSATQSGPSYAVASLNPTEGNTVSGRVTFRPMDKGVRVEADITGLSNGKHGFHVHAKGDCSAPDASSAGGHFNPDATAHGAPGDQPHHVGDLGNIEADETGRATLEREFPFLSLSGNDGIAGKAVIVHAGADDLESQPSGDAGARVACGVIRDFRM